MQSTLTLYLPLYLTVFSFSFVITALLEKILIPKLSQTAKQPIYADGPSWHIAKSGTPTMGGIAFLAAVLLAVGCASALLLFRGDVAYSYSILISLFFAVANALVGVIDDLTKLRRKENAGLSPKEKLLLQSVLCIAFLALRKWLLFDDTAISLPMGNFDLDVFYYPLALFMLLGIINCANLTDGVDGLAASVALAIGVVLFYMSSSVAADAAILSTSLIGASVAFLFFNLHPAKIFMGDTGSLFLGALAVSIVFTLDNPLLIIPIGFVYVVEGCSVILQVLYYKKTKKRLFKMAPLHHHLEKCGVSENAICITAIITTLIFSLFALLIY